MYRQLLFFFYTLFIEINNIIGISAFLLPFYLCKNTLYANIILFFINAFFFIILFITHYRIKKNIVLGEVKKESYLYFLSDCFYYISILSIIMINIFYINSIIALYNNISFFYNVITIIVILFLFILIKNKSSSIECFLAVTKCIVFIYFAYCLFNIKNIAGEGIIENNTIIKNILDSIPLLFFSFLGNDYIFHIEEDNENQNTMNYTRIVITFVLVSLFYIFFYMQLIKSFNYNIFLYNTNISAILLKNYMRGLNVGIHFLNVLMILVSFFNIYTLILKCQKIIEKIIQKTNQYHIIPEIIILFFIFFSILVSSKILFIRNKIILIGVFFATLSFFCYLLNSFRSYFSLLDKCFIGITILFILIINIISANQFINT